MAILSSSSCTTVAPPSSISMNPRGLTLASSMMCLAIDRSSFSLRRLFPTSFSSILPGRPDFTLGTAPALR